MYWQKMRIGSGGDHPCVSRAQVSTEDLLVTRVKRTESRGTRGEWIVPCGDRRVVDVSDFFSLSGSMSERGIPVWSIVIPCGFWSVSRSSDNRWSLKYC